MKSVVFTIAVLSFFAAATAPVAWGATPSQTKAALNKSAAKSKPPVTQVKKPKNGCSTGNCTRAGAAK